MVEREKTAWRKFGVGEGCHSGSLRWGAHPEIDQLSWPDFVVKFWIRMNHDLERERENLENLHHPWSIRETVIGHVSLWRKIRGPIRVRVCGGWKSGEWFLPQNFQNSQKPAESRRIISLIQKTWIPNATVGKTLARCHWWTPLSYRKVLSAVDLQTAVNMKARKPSIDCSAGFICFMPNMARTHKKSEYQKLWRWSRSIDHQGSDNLDLKIID